MPKLNILNMQGGNSGEIELSETVFGAEVNVPVLHSVVRAYLLNQRQGTQSTRTRSEVSGGGKKPWRQKGTGRARQGSTRAPQWTHGGVALGPKPRLYKVSVNKKARKVAMRSALSSKTADGEIVVIDKIEFAEYKTKAAVEFLKAVGAEGKTLIVTVGSDPKVYRSAGNIPRVKTSPVSTLNVYDVLNCDKLVIAKDAVARLEEVYA